MLFGRNVQDCFKVVFAQAKRQGLILSSPTRAIEIEITLWVKNAQVSLQPHHGQTLAKGRNLGRVFNYRYECASVYMITCTSS